MSEFLLEARDLTKSYQEGKSELTILKQVNLALKPRSLNAIIGTSGSGKSTLLHLLSGLDGATSGDVRFNGTSIFRFSEKQMAQFRNRDIGFIYQFHHLLNDFSALENVMLPLLIGRVAPKEAQDRALELLQFLNLEHRKQHRPSELSGGERQRIAIARSVVTQPQLVFADEPTGNLDKHNAEHIFELLFALNDRYQTAFLVVTHDQALANQLPTQFEMNDGVLTPKRALGIDHDA